MALYEETPEAGNAYREAFLTQFETWLDEQFAEAGRRRADAFALDLSSVAAYTESIEPHRLGLS